MSIEPVANRETSSVEHCVQALAEWQPIKMHCVGRAKSCCEETEDVLSLVLFATARLSGDCQASVTASVTASSVRRRTGIYLPLPPSRRFLDVMFLSEILLMDFRVGLIQFNRCERMITKYDSPPSASLVLFC